MFGRPKKPSKMACFPRAAGVAITQVEVDSMAWKVERGGQCSDHWRRMHKLISQALDAIKKGQDRRALLKIRKMARSFRAANMCERKMNGRDY